MTNPTSTPQPPREIEPLNGQRRAHCDTCGMTFPIAGDRHFDGTRYWQPLDITVLLAERDALARAGLAATAREAQHAALLAAARAVQIAGGQLFRNAFQPNPPLYINDTEIEMAMVVAHDLRDLEQPLAALVALLPEAS